MDRKILTITLIILLVILVIYLWRKNKDISRECINSNEVLIVETRNRHFPKPNIGATFERDGGNQDYKFEVNATGLDGIKLPKNFSAIKQWGSMIIGVYDQEACGSCWAFSTTSALTDRIRINSKGEYLKDGDYLSPFHLAACMKCGVGQTCADVCQGNYLDDVLEYLVQHGCAAQSDIEKYSSQDEEYRCFDYAKHGVRSWKGIRKYRVNLFPPGMLGSAENRLTNETSIMEEVYKHGPVCCIIKVFVPKDSRNFYNYKSGVYGYGWDKEPSTTDGYHAINIVGWGEETKNGKLVKYWIVRNSWGNEWGTSGFGKIIRGQNFGMIESDVFGITPAL